MVCIPWSYRCRYQIWYGWARSMTITVPLRGRRLWEDRTYGSFESHLRKSIQTDSEYPEQKLHFGRTIDIEFTPMPIFLKTTFRGAATKRCVKNRALIAGTCIQLLSTNWRLNGKCIQMTIPVFKTPQSRHAEAQAKDRVDHLVWWG